MGYTTQFRGEFKLNKPADANVQYILRGLHDTRRIKRALPTAYGYEGEFYFGDSDFGVLDFNSPPATQPSLYCQWKLMSDNLTIAWDGGEKFYEYIDWLKYIVHGVLKPHGYILNGEVRYRGEEFDDFGTIQVIDNMIIWNEGIF